MIYDSIRVASHENFVLYLRKSGYLKAGKVALVDVGWNGTMQKHLFATGMRSEVYGYYIGSISKSDSLLHNKKVGILFNSESSTGAFSHSCYNYECVCVADHGSVHGYNADGEPIFAKDGDVDLYNQIFHEVQTNIKKKFDMMCKLLNEKEFDEQYFAFKHIQMLLDLSKVEKELLHISFDKHRDGLVDIRIKRPIKTRLFLIKHFVRIKLQYFKYRYLVRKLL